MDQSKMQRFDKGVKLYEVGQPINELYLIVSGSVIDTVGSEAVSRGMGGVLSPANVLSRSNQSYSTATISTSDTYLRTIPMELAFKLMINPDFRFKNDVKAQLIEMVGSLFPRAARAIWLSTC